MLLIPVRKNQFKGLNQSNPIDLVCQGISLSELKQQINKFHTTAV